MPELSKLEQMIEDAKAKTNAVMLRVWEVQGVAEVDRLAFLEANVELLVAPGLKVYAKCGDLSSRGSSHEHLVDFAKRVHLHYEEQLGGIPVPLGADPGPVAEGITQQAAKIEALRKATDAARERAEAQRAELADFHARKMAEHLMEQAPDPRRMF